MDQEKASAVVQCRVSAEVQEALKEGASKVGVTVSELLRRLVDAYVKPKGVSVGVESPVVRGMAAITRDGGPVSGEKDSDPPRPSKSLAEAYAEFVLPPAVAAEKKVCIDCGQEVEGNYAFTVKFNPLCQPCAHKRADGTGSYISAT